MTRRSIALFGCVLIAYTVSVTPSSAEIPRPTSVIGPLPATPTTYPFGAADRTRIPLDLKQDGYVEEEFLFSGVANVYDWPAEGLARVKTSNAPYTTRVLVRRPANRARFSGNVILEPLNPSNRFDLNIGWAISRSQWMRNGDAWVGVTSKPISVVALKAFDPMRYAALSWANPLPMGDPANCVVVANDSAMATENGLLWDVLRQVGAWVRSADTLNPLGYGGRNGRHPVEHLYAWGYSQSGSFLVTYVNAVHALDVAQYGKTLFDAYFIAVPGGPTPINQCTPAPPAGDPRRAIKSIGVPVMRVMTQSDYMRVEKRADSDTAPDLFRHYDIAGSAHATPDELNYAAAPADLVKARVADPPMNCNEGPRSRFPNSVAFNAAFRNLDAWVRHGTLPPRAGAFQVVDGKPVLDEFGNLKGGVRSPFVDVPAATWTGTSTGASFCFIAGHEIPLNRDRLKTLYPTHAAYVQKVRQSVMDLVAKRFIVREDGLELIEQAKKAGIP